MASTAAQTNGAARAGTRNVPRGRGVTKDEVERMENPPEWGFTIPSTTEARKPTCTRPLPRRHLPCHDSRVVILDEHDRPPKLPGPGGRGNPRARRDYIWYVAAFVRSPDRAEGQLGSRPEGVDDDMTSA